jgi:hypothetical protein
VPLKKKRCLECKEYEEVTNGIECNSGFLCSKDCLVEYQTKKAMKTVIRARATEAKKKRLKEKEEKLSIKPKSKWLSEAQAAFNKYIRARDYYLPCISCGKPRELIEAEQGHKLGGCWDSGHFMTRGAKGQLRFVLYNAHKQCKPCNAGGGKFSHKAATVDTNYKINLIDKIGVDKVGWLENSNDIDYRKGDVDYLKRIKTIFTKRARFYNKRIEVNIKLNTI